MGFRYDTRHLTPQQQAIIAKKNEEAKFLSKLPAPQFDIWDYLQDHLTPGIDIPNWTVLKGLLGDYFKVVVVEENKIVIDTPKALNQINLYRAEVEKIWLIWPEYKTSELQRSQLIGITRYSKYLISLFHWVDEVLSKDV